MALITHKLTVSSAQAITAALRDYVDGLTTAYQDDLRAPLMAALRLRKPCNRPLRITSTMIVHQTSPSMIAIRMLAAIATTRKMRLCASRLCMSSSA